MSRSIGIDSLAATAIRTGLPVLGGLSFTAAAFAAAVHHPVAPGGAVLALGCMALWIARRPGDIWFLLPALLPVASFTPWTGWWLADESDLLVLATLGAAYLRWGWDVWSQPAAASRQLPYGVCWVYLVLLPLLVLGVWRGLDDARGAEPWAALLSDLWAQGFYGDYDLPGNTLRVAKSLAWGLLLMPALYRWGEGAALRLARGMVAGLVVVCTAVLWERCVYADGLDFNEPYRTSAWFWEMHVGGGAIDAYLALALPFAWWAAWVARRGWRWVAAAALLVVAIYAVLTTYSRGVYLSVSLALAALAVLLHRYRIVSPDRSLWHWRAIVCLVAILVVETLTVLLGGSFMSDRLARSGADLSQRMAHWQRGVALLRTPTQWLLGLGVGRLPAHYSTQTFAGALAGQVRWKHSADGSTQAWLAGPAGPDMRGEVALVQRVPLVSGGAYKVRLGVEVSGSARMALRLCERHLLYAFKCQTRLVHVPLSREARITGLELALQGPDLAPPRVLSGVRYGVLSVTVLGPDESVGLHAIELLDPYGQQVIKNPSFLLGERYWNIIADGNFLPWHMDNLFLELLIERGLVGLGFFMVLASGALAMTVRGMRRYSPLAPVIGVAMSAVFVLGSVVSFIEIPRVSIMLWLLLAVSPLVIDD
ncbi:hypothetical protein B2J88_20585 [Rhodococcus sp. SRB_17]|nr:hypothetical protein [Rhodococcus sp. SRB_17]